MSVLLTGVGGFVGSHVLEALLEDTAERVVVTDSFRHNGSTDRVIGAMRPEDRSRVTVLTHDLAAPFSNLERDIVVKASVDTIVSVASYCQVEQSIREPSDFILNNVHVVLNVLDLVRHLDARLIHMSTDEVYGVGGLDHAPSSPYAASKAAQEDIIHAYWTTYGLRAQVVRSCNMLGERQSQLAFVPRVIKALTRGDTITVHAIDSKPGSRWYTYVRNVADYVVELIQDTSNLYAHHHNLAGQWHYDNMELVQDIAELVGVEPKTELVEGTSVRPGYDSDYAQLRGNDRWHAAIEMSEGLERTVKWALANPEWLEL